MTDYGFRDILKSASVVGAGMIFSKGISLFAETVVARELAASEFGAAIFAYTILLTVGGIALIGIPEGFTYYLSILDERDDTDTAFRIIISGIVILTIVIATSFLTIYIIPFPFIERFGISREQWQWIKLLAPLVIAYPVTQISFGIMRGYDRSAPKVLSGDILNKLIALGALGIAIWQSSGILIFLSFYLGQYLLSGVFAGGYVIYLLKMKLTRVTKLDQFNQDARRLFSYSWPLAFKNATRRLLGNTDIVLVGALLASSAVGYYRVGYVISQLGMITLISITYLYTPRVARRYDNNDHKGMEQLYRQATKWSTLLTLPLIVPMLYFPDEIIQILFGAEYTAGSVVLTILAADILFRVGMGPASATLQAIDRTRVDFATTIITMILNAGMSYILVSNLGILGAAIGTFISILFMNTIQVLLVYRYTTLHPYTLRYVAGVFTLVTASIPVSLLTEFAVGDAVILSFDIPAIPFVFVAVFCIVELVIIWNSGLLSPDEKKSILKILRDNRLPFIR
ncbi:flippase [Halorubrum sp. Hd13]|uniref:flippase n=1 Tax=Halorubrum sp. Hd13 TaxID=1480728 RepID=UPI000B98A582|nr:flippase [Halorubrum sp. Hd13]OYR42850.1 hypothetical protein DJ81_10525 [Halorubrum sp. Hd13]